MSIKKLIIKNTFSYVEGISWKNNIEILHHDNLSFENIQKYKFAKLKKLVDYAYNNIPFYKKIYDINKVGPQALNSFKDLEKFPIITKEDLKKNFEVNIVGNRSKVGWIHDATSGTTGTPYQFYTTRKALGIKKAILYRSWGWLDYTLGNKYIRVWSLINETNRGGFKKRIYDFYTNKIYGRMQIASQELITKENVRLQVKKILAYKPTMMTGLISSIMILTEYIKDNNLSFPKIPIIVYGETLTEFKKHYLEKYLSPYIYCEYGLGETRSFAFECKKRTGLHITESVHIEIINKNKTVKAGLIGKVIITDLDNYAMPFIRYDTNDISSFSNKKCSCNRPYPLLKKVYGRESEHIITRDGKIMGLNHFTQLIGHDYNLISKWQVIQDSYDSLKIKIVPSKKFDNNKKIALIKKIHRYLGDSIVITVLVVDKIEPTKSGKNKLIISNLKKW
jgi:phenylacetate-CoA ligase